MKGTDQTMTDLTNYLLSDCRYLSLEEDSGIVYKVPMQEIPNNNNLDPSRFDIIYATKNKDLYAYSSVVDFLMIFDNKYLRAYTARHVVLESFGISVDPKKICMIDYFDILSNIKQDVKALTKQIIDDSFEDPHSLIRLNQLSTKKEFVERAFVSLAHDIQEQNEHSDVIDNEFTELSIPLNYFTMYLEKQDISLITDKVLKANPQLSCDSLLERRFEEKVIQFAKRKLVGLKIYQREQEILRFYRSLKEYRGAKSLTVHYRVNKLKMTVKIENIANSERVLLGIYENGLDSWVILNHQQRDDFENLFGFCLQLEHIDEITYGRKIVYARWMKIPETMV